MENPPDVFRDFFYWSLVLMMGGAMVGFVPSVITGLCLVRWRISIKNIISYLHIALIGWGVTAIYSFVLYFCLISFDLWKFGLFLSNIGAISAVILAHFVLPKTNQHISI